VIRDKLIIIYSFFKLKIFFRILKKLIRIFQNCSSPVLSCYIQNLLFNNKVYFGYNDKKKLFFVQQRNLIKFFCNFDRGVHLYSKGILHRGNHLGNSYCLQNIDFKDNDIIVDCGANYGDLHLYLYHCKNININYIAFEPDPNPYNCLLNNIPQTKIFNLGLSNKKSEVNFYISERSGDSSIIEPNSYTKIINIETTTMDIIFPDLQIDRCKLFKIEAEGFEPEILEGSKFFLKICEYVCIDGGPERGIKKVKTFDELEEYLLNNDFELVESNMASHRALYKNKLMKS